MFCPGEPIIVKCTVRSLGITWHIGETSFVIFGKVDVNIFAGRYHEGLYVYMDSAYGRLNFYQNGSYVGSTFADTTLYSELHMHLENANDFIEVTCKELHQNNKTINITVFPGMLIMALNKLICYCKVILLYFFFTFFTLRSTSSYSNYVDNNASSGGCNDELSYA